MHRIILEHKRFYSVRLMCSDGKSLNPTLFDTKNERPQVIIACSSICCEEKRGEFIALKSEKPLV